MKTNGLVDVLTFSEKRRDAFLYLIDGPKTLDQIKTHLKVSTPEIQPRLKELQAENMVEKVYDDYKLTQLGEIAAHYLKMFYETTNAIDRHKHFWNTHDLTTIPKEFLLRIKELNSCELVRLDDCNLCESHEEFIESVANSIYFKGATSIFIREWIYLFSELSKERIPIEIIITPDIYKKIKKEYSEELEIGLQNPNARMYVCDEQRGFSFATSKLLTDESFFSLSLNFKNDLGHDHKHDLISFDWDAFKWGEDLFEYYKCRSTEIKSSQCSGSEFKTTLPLSLLIQQ